MENYLSGQYLGKLELLFASTSEEFLTGEVTGLLTLFQLLNALPLNTNLSDDEIDEYTRSLSGNKQYGSYKERFILNAIKNQKLRQCEFEGQQFYFKNHSAYYFLEDEKMAIAAHKNGIICQGPDFQGRSFYEDCSVADLPIKDNWIPIESAIPTANAMIMIDHYLFGNPLKTKLKSLIEFIHLYKSGIETIFHLTILFSTEHKGKEICTVAQVQQAFSELCKTGNIEIQLFVDNNIIRPDRLIFTNYTSGNIGHPFDERDTRFNQNFLGAENKAAKIILNYQNYKKDLLYWHSVISKIPKFIGLVQTSWETSKFVNRIFEPYFKSKEG